MSIAQHHRTARPAAEVHQHVEIAAFLIMPRRPVYRNRAGENSHLCAGEARVFWVSGAIPGYAIELNSYTPPALSATLIDSTTLPPRWARRHQSDRRFLIRPTGRFAEWQPRAEPRNAISADHFEENFSSLLNVISIFQPPAKNCTSIFQKCMLSSRHPASMQRGVTANRHETWGGMRWTRRCRVRMRSQGEATRERTRAARETSGSVADGEVVWSWHPLLMPSLAEAHSARPGYEMPSNPRGDGGKRNSSPGRAPIIRKTIAWGMPDVFRCLRCEDWCAY